MLSFLVSFGIVMCIINAGNLRSLEVDQCIPTEIDWDKLMSNGQTPQTDIQFSFEPNLFEFDFTVELEYIGFSTSRITKDKVGTCYIIDFSPFTEKDSLNQPNNCGNRVLSSFIHRDFKEWWSHSISPRNEGHIGSNRFLSYPPPSQYWNISYIYSNDETKCGNILYHGKFSLKELMECTDRNNAKIINIQQDNANYYISGTLYISIVSPLSYSLKINRVYALNKYPFQLKLAKSITVSAMLGN